LEASLGDAERMRFGPYEVVDELARGGMGAVYAVVHVETGARYALKTLLPEALGDEEERTRFLREARALAQLQHPNLVRVFSAESEGPRPYLVQELLPGGSLQDRIYSQGPLPTAEAVELTLQVADALALAHSEGILHRDLKPANILVAEDGSTRLADFGLAKRLHGESIRLTKTGQLLGTPAFMAPEQANGLPCDARTDVYGLGAVLHALLSGRPPFAAKSLMGVLNKVMNDKPLPLEGQPRSLRAVLGRAMAKDISERQPTMRAFADELRAALGSGGDRRGGALLGLGVLLAVSALAAAGWVVSREDEVLTPSIASELDTSPRPSPSSKPSLSPAVSPPALVPRQRFVLTGGRPLHLAYSPDARHLAVVSDSKSKSLGLEVYDAKSGTPVHSTELTGVVQLAVLPRGDFVAGLKGRLVFGGRSRIDSPYAQGTLESLCSSPTADSVLVSLEEPSALELVRRVGRNLRRVRLAHEGAAHELVVWAERGPLAVSREGVQALQVEGGTLRLRGALYPVKGFADPTVGIYWGQSVVLGNRIGRVIAVELDGEGAPISHSDLKRSGGSGPLGDWRAHTDRVHAFLRRRDPPQVVSVARSAENRNGAMARWRRDSRGAWSLVGDFDLRPSQLCVTQGGFEREWVAAAVQDSETIFLEQTPSKQFLRR